MKSIRLIFGILLILLVFGCKKHDNEDQYGNYKIKSINTLYENYQTYEGYLLNTKKENFTYDSEGRLTEKEVIIPDTTLFTYYQYYDSFIVVQNMIPTSLSVWSGIDTLFLNPEGFCIKRVSDYLGIINYKYDSDGFMIQDGYSKLDENIVEYKRVFHYPGEDLSDTLITLYDYNDNKNTIYYDDKDIEYYSGNNNIGIYFWGKQNKKLLKSTDFNLGTGSGLTEFSYEFDESKRVVKMEISYDGSLVQTKNFEYY